jgi:hypothetical protein
MFAIVGFTNDSPAYHGDGQDVPAALEQAS